MSTGLKIALGILAAIVLFVVVLGGAVAGTYNSLVQLDQGVQSQGAQVQNVYQRRADLVPNLVGTVKGAANSDRSYRGTSKSWTGHVCRARKHSARPAGVPTLRAGPGRLVLRLVAPDGCCGAISRTEGHAELSRPAGAAGRNRESNFGGADEIQ